MGRVDGRNEKKYQSNRQLERQSAILACAREMIEADGYAGLTMRDLARRAGVAPATLYNLYGGKDDLIIAAIDEMLTSLGERAIAAQVAPGIGALNLMTQLTAEHIRNNPECAEAMTRALFNVRAGDPLVAGLFARGYPFRAHQLRIAQRDGNIAAEVDVDTIAKHLTGDGWGQMLLWIMGSFTLAESCIEQLRSQLMTLISVTRGAVRERLEAQLHELGWEQGDLGRNASALANRSG